MSFDVERDLPTEPVDGYVLVFWTVICESVVEQCWTYYVNTPWKTYRSNWGDGAALIDCWMIAQDGYVTGRAIGWAAGRRGVSDVDRFATREQAVRYLKGKLALNVLSARRELKRAERMLLEVR